MDIPVFIFSLILHFVKADTYFILKDFRSYADAHKRVEEAYRDEKGWAKTAILNVKFHALFQKVRPYDHGLGLKSLLRIGGRVLGEGYSHLEPVECPQDVESADYLKIEFLKLRRSIRKSHSLQITLPNGCGCLLHIFHVK